jgi:hypothetical protein
MAKIQINLPAVMLFDIYGSLKSKIRIYLCRTLDGRLVFSYLKGFYIGGSSARRSGVEFLTATGFYAPQVHFFSGTVFLGAKRIFHAASALKLQHPNNSGSHDIFNLTYLSILD